MSSTFLKALRVLEKEMLKDNSNMIGISYGTKNVLKRLICFVEQGQFTESSVEQFILQNFRMSAIDMTKKWNRIHFDKPKSSNTFRGQISSLNSYLVSLFGISTDELNAAFINEDSKVLKRLMDIIEAIELGDFNLATRFPLLTQGYLGCDETTSEYAVAECVAEIQLLKTLDKSVIDELVQSVDIDKLVYVLQSIREPLISDVYLKREGKKSKVKTVSLNKKKLDFCKAFNLVKPKVLKPVNEIEVSSGVIENVFVKEIEKVVEVPENIPYEFGISREMLLFIENVIEQYKLLPKSEQIELQKASDSRSVRKCTAFLDMLTIRGFENMVRSLNSFDLYTIIDGYRK